MSESAQSVQVVYKAVVYVPPYIKSYFKNNRHLHREFYAIVKMLLSKRTGALIEREATGVLPLPGEGIELQYETYISVVYPQLADSVPQKVVKISIGAEWAKMLRGIMADHFNYRLWLFIEANRNRYKMHTMIEDFIRLHELDGLITEDTLIKRYQLYAKANTKSTRFRKVISYGTD